MPHLQVNVFDNKLTFDNDSLLFPINDEDWREYSLEEVLTQQFESLEICMLQKSNRHPASDIFLGNLSVVLDLIVKKNFNDVAIWNYTSIFPKLPYLPSVKKFHLLQKSNVRPANVSVEYFANCEHIQLQRLSLSSEQVEALISNPVCLDLGLIEVTLPNSPAFNIQPRTLPFKLIGIQNTGPVRCAAPVEKLVILNSKLKSSQLNLSRTFALILENAQLERNTLPKPERIPHLQILHIKSTSLESIPVYPGLIDLEITEAPNLGLETIKTYRQAGLQHFIYDTDQFPSPIKPVEWDSTSTEFHERKNWGQAICNNEVDPISFNLFTPETQILTLITNNSSNTSSIAHCFELRSLIKYWRKLLFSRENLVFQWIVNDPKHPANGQANIFEPVFKVPGLDVWVDLSSYKLIFKFSSFSLVNLGPHRLGSQFGMSRIHGEIYNLYTLSPLSNRQILAWKQTGGVLAFHSQDATDIPRFETHDLDILPHWMEQALASCELAKPA